VHRNCAGTSVQAASPGRVLVWRLTDVNITLARAYGEIGRAATRGTVHAAVRELRAPSLSNAWSQQMRIGFIGAGTVGRTMGRHFVNAGHEVVISNSRGPESLRGVVGELGPPAKAGTREEAVQSDLVILCVNWAQAQEALKGLAWDGRILVDATNAHMDSRPDISLEGVGRSRAALAKTGRTSSGARCRVGSKRPSGQVHQ
jgi:NADP oxidoreductase coenzyme F420-dependent